MNVLIISFIFDIVFGSLFFIRRKGNRITEKDLEETEHNDVII